MNHFKNHILSLILAVLFLLGAGAISFYAIFRGTPAFAEAIINPRTSPETAAATEPAQENPGDPSGATENNNPEAGKEKNDKTNNEGDKTEDNEGSGNDKDDTETERIRLKIVKVENKETGQLDSNYKTVEIEVIDDALKGQSQIPKITISFDDDDDVLHILNKDCTATDYHASTNTYTIKVDMRVSKLGDGVIPGVIKYADSTIKDRDFTLNFSAWVPIGENPNIYNLQSYRFYDDDGDLITKLTKGKKIDKLVVTLKDGGFTKEVYDNMGKSQFTASLNYDTFTPLDRNQEPHFSNTAVELPDGCVSYEVFFYDLRYTGDTKELVVKIGYPQSFGLERREFTESLPEGELYQEKNDNTSSSESSSSEAEIAPPTPRLIIRSYDYGGQALTAASSAKLNLTFQNVSRQVPVDNVVLKIAMPEAFTLTNSSNSFYFERIGREREKTVSIDFTVKPTAEATSQAIKLSFAFEAVIGNQRTQLTSEEEITIPVVQINRMMVSSVETPPEIYIGDNSGSIEASFVNKGKTAVYNVTASIEGKNIAQTGQTQFIGNVESGIEKSIDFSLEALEPGPITGEIILSYEDANMRISEIRTAFSTQAIAMDTGPSPDEMDAMAQPQEPPTEAPAWYAGIPTWYWAAGGFVGLIILAYLIKLTRVSRITLLEDDDEDF
ncbi:MAG: hypothetical protein HFG18_04345 [Oscillospiraceae bacterium]|nr:hypothetical protein [Oscillospiraceae bacterium]